MEHLTDVDFERYIACEDENKEYFLWMDKIEQHLDGCETCSKRLARVINAQVCVDKLFSGEALRDLAQEDKLKKELLVQQLRLAGEKIRANQLAAAIASGNIFVKKINANAFAEMNQMSLDRYMSGLPKGGGHASSGAFMSTSSSVNAVPDNTGEYMSMRTRRNGEYLELIISGGMRNDVVVVITDRKNSKAEPVVLDARYQQRAAVCSAAVDFDKLPEECTIFYFDPRQVKSVSKNNEKKEKKSEGIGSLLRFFNRER